VRLLPNCAAADRFGWLNEHLKAIFEIAGNGTCIAAVVHTLLNGKLVPEAAELLSANAGIALDKGILPE
jgi:hypothetical protein